MTKYHSKCKLCTKGVSDYKPRIYCSRSCRAKGVKRSMATRERISIGKRGSKNPMWKGGEVGYSSLHQWVRGKLPGNGLCNECLEVGPTDLANISGKYLRDLSDWEYLCRRCHMMKDGRLLKLMRYHPCKCPTCGLQGPLESFKPAVTS